MSSSGTELGSSQFRSRAVRNANRKPPHWEAAFRCGKVLLEAVGFQNRIVPSNSIGNNPGVGHLPGRRSWLFIQVHHRRLRRAGRHLLDFG
jgi:hypothetical protein